MNKKHLALPIIIFSIVIFILNSELVSPAEGCCFLNYTDVCYEGDETECAGEEGEFFTGVSCADVGKCTFGCCCEAIPSYDPYPIQAGTCNETFKGSFLPLSEGACIDLCDGLSSSDIPRCNDDCILNPSPEKRVCRGNGRIVDQNDPGVGPYYCWLNNLTYSTEALCRDESTGCLPIEQCTLDAEITETCYCGSPDSFQYAAGYCCWDNSYSSTDESACPEANNCERYPDIGTPYNCCDGCLSDEPDDVYPDADYDGIPANNNCPAVDQPNCCQECAPVAEGCCDEGWQCDIQDRLTQYTYSSCGPPIDERIPCRTSCDEPKCLIGERISLGNPGKAKCDCNGVYYNTTTETRFCCIDGPSPLSCDTNRFNLTGYVYNTTENNKVPGAEVIVETATTTYPPIITDDEGDYFVENIILESGYIDFNVFVMKDGFYPFETTIDFPTEPTTLEGHNFQLTPIEAICAASPPINELNVNHIKGVKEVELTWEEPSEPPSQVMGYLITSSHFDVGTFFTSNTQFIDDNIEWDATYNYQVRVLYASGGISIPVMGDITTGKEDCEGVFNDDEFCSDNRRRNCDVDNKFILDEDCSLNSRVCIDTGADTACTSEINCREKANPLGLFCDNGECFEDDEYCYYDYSDTTVDESNNCSKVIDCYDYKSESACIENDCSVNSECKWHYTFEEFGKGFCYEEDYEGTDKCSLCNTDSDLFYNVNCEQSTCTKLGNCHLSYRESSEEPSCEPCQGNMECEMYDTEESCVNANSLGPTPISITWPPINIIRSHDACNLGGCKWGDAGDGQGTRCFKDANDDNDPDCAGELCTDFTPFNTRIPGLMEGGAMRGMNYEGRDITFELTQGPEEITSGKAYLYFCIDKENTCDPSVNERETTDNGVGRPHTVMINPLEEYRESNLFDESRNYFIRYYSIDSNYNVEEVKSTSFFVDPLPPIMTFGDRAYTENEDNYIEISIISEECVTCSYETNGLTPEATNLDSSGNEFFISFKNLEEGNYILKTECVDEVGNSINNTHNFYIDFVHGLTIGYPNEERINTANPAAPNIDVTIDLTTQDNSTCILEAVDASNDGIPYNLLPEEPVTMDKVELVKHQLYNYTKTLALEKDVSYVVRATCIPIIPGTIDSGLFYFTIDTQGPIVTTDSQFGTDIWYQSENPLSNEITIDFECNDPEIPGYPEEAGCEKIYLCEGQNCNLYNLEITGPDYKHTTSSSHISYYAVDADGNEGTIHRNIRILIDGEDPTVTIIRPSAYYTPSKTQTIRVQAPDATSGIDYVNITIKKGYPTYEVIEGEALLDVNDEYIWTTELFDGLNEITAKACDMAGNCDYDTHSIYVDLFGPTIYKISMSDSITFTDSLAIAELRVFEYGENLSFAVEIKDEYTHVNNLEQGIGVNSDKIFLTITNSQGTVVTSHNMVLQEGNLYTQKITQLLPVGEYDLTIEAYDNFDNYRSKTTTFEIRDTRPPTLILTEGILPSDSIRRVYYSTLQVTGFTDPLIDVDIYVRSGNDQEERYSGQGADVSEPHANFIDIPLGLNPDTNSRNPNEEEEYIYFDVDYTNILFEGYYLEFSGQTRTERYRITNVQSLGFSTNVTIEPPLEEDVIGEPMVTAYSQADPTGYFDIPIVLNEGLNHIRVIATATTGPTTELTRKITYDSSGLDLTQESPADGKILYYNDFYPEESITIGARTAFAAQCYVINEQDNSVARAFNYEMTASSNGLEHTFDIDSTKCTSNGESFCYINDDLVNNQLTGIIYHKYLIRCDPTETDMASEEIDICFGITTYRDIVGPEGQNICSAGANDCIPNNFPSACASIVPNCNIGIEITNSCLCDGTNIASGFCCLYGHSDEECSESVVCPHGPITYSCDCGEETYAAGSGYCCNNQHQPTQCHVQGTRIR